METPNPRPSKAWIIITSPKQDQKVVAGSKLAISGQLARVQREPSIQVTLYQSHGTHNKNGVVLVKANIPVYGSAKFRGTLAVPKYSVSKGSHFTLVFKYPMVQQKLTYPLGS